MWILNYITCSYYFLDVLGLILLCLYYKPSILEHYSYVLITSTIIGLQTNCIGD